MAHVTSQQNSLTSGEWSPKAFGRFDLDQYKSAVKKLENFLVRQLGGGLFRPGTRYVAGTKSDGVARIFPFQHEADEDYVVEAGDLYFKIYENNADNVNITQNTSPYPLAQSDTYVKATTKSTTSYWPYFATDPSLSVTGNSALAGWLSSNGTTTNQRFHIDLGSAKIVTRIYYENYHASGEGENIGVQNFTFWGSNTASDFADLTYANDGTWVELTTDISAFVEHPAEDAASPQYVEVTNSTAYRYYAFKFADNWGHGSYMGVRRLELKATVLSTEIETTYAEADLFDLHYAQNNDVMYIVHPDYAPRKLSRTGATSFAIEDVSFKRGPLRDTNITATTITPSADAGAGITLTASGNIFDEDHVGSLWRIKDGMVEITDYTNATTVTATVQAEPDGSAGDLNTGPAATTDWAEGAFSAYRGYPATVAFHDQRLYYGRTASEPQKFWGSYVGAYDSFDTTATTDDYSFAYEVATEQRNAIRWMVSGIGVLSIGTTGGTFSASASETAEPITPTNIMVTRDTNYGCAILPPKRISSLLYYVQRDFQKMRELSYSFELDSQISNDMTLFSEHILRDGTSVVDLAHQQSPNDRIWCVRGDGTIAALTRNPEQEVMGWSRIIAGYDAMGDGEFESICVIPKSESDDQIWVVVKRNINGSTRRFIEYFTTENFNDDWDAICCDSSVTRDDPQVITAMTNASPGVFTIADHTFSTDDQVKIDGIILADVSGETSTEINGIYTVVKIDADTFSLKTLAGAAVNTTTGNGYGVYVSGGEARLMTDAVTGLSHLVGETVVAQVDGSIPSTETYTVQAGGLLTLSAKAAVVHCGLPYKGTIQLMKLSDGSPRGTGQMQIRRIHKIALRLDRTQGLSIGRAEGDVDDVIYDVDGEASTDLYTGDIRKTFKTTWNRNDELIIQQDKPLPADILCIIIESEVS